MRASFTRIAWRNLWRNRRRTGLALAAIGLSTALVLTFNGVLRAYSDWMVAGDRGALKAVLGGSYRFSVGNGIPVFAEYHYSGFGATHATEILTLLADPRFRSRFERGDTQILGRHAFTVSATYEVSPELATGLRWILSPRDGSGVIVPTATATLGDRLSLVAAVYVPWGASPSGLTLQSEYGSAALTGFVQLIAAY